MKPFLCAAALAMAAPAALADQCAWISGAAASKALQILKPGMTVLHFCEPCGDKEPGKPFKVLTVMSTPKGGGLAEISINGAEEDLAYLFIYMSKHKTFENAAHLAGCPAEVVEALTRYGETIGVAFQLSDDILDIASDSDDSGKTPGTDLREGVAVVTMARERARNAFNESMIEELDAAFRVLGADPGVRVIVLVHLRDNAIGTTCLPWQQYAGPVPVRRRAAPGLSPFGGRVVERMNALGLLVDVAHADRTTCLGVVDRAAAPVVSSHSGARAVQESARQQVERLDKELSLAIAAESQANRAARDAQRGKEAAARAADEAKRRLARAQTAAGRLG